MVLWKGLQIDAGYLGMDKDIEDRGFAKKLSSKNDGLFSLLSPSCEGHP